MTVFIRNPHSFFSGSIKSRTRFSFFNGSSGGGSSGGGGSSWTPFSIPNLIGWMQCESTYHMWQEVSPTNTPVTHASASSLVGTLDDPALAAFRWESLSGGSVPRLSGSTDINAALYFSGSASTAGMGMQVWASADAFNFIHQALTGTICLKVKFYEDGRIQDIMDSCNGTTSNTGMYMSKTAANRLQFQITKGIPGQSIINYTTTGTVLASSGTIPIVVRLGHSTSSAAIRVGTGSWEIMPILTSNYATASSFTNLIFGRKVGSVGNTFQGLLGHILIVSGVMSDSDISNYLTYNPTLTTSPLIQSVGSASGTFNFLYGWYDFGDASATGTVYQDLAGTIPVTASGQTINKVRHKNKNTDFSGWHRSISSSAGFAGAPTYYSGSGSYYGGVNNPAGLTLHEQMHTGGGMTNFFVVQNDRQTGVSGSHIVTSGPGSFYLAITNDTYGNPPRVVQHTALDADDCAFSSSVGWKLIEMRRNGKIMYMRVYEPGIGTTASGTVSTSGSVGNAGIFNVSWVGMSGSTGWYMSGSIREIMMFNTYLSSSQADQVQNYLKLKWGL